MPRYPNIGARARVLPPTPKRNSDNPLVAKAIALGAEPPVFELSKFPNVGGRWLALAELLVAQHGQLTAHELVKLYRDLLLYSGAPLRGWRP